MIILLIRGRWRSYNIVFEWRDSASFAFLIHQQNMMRQLNFWQNILLFIKEFILFTALRFTLRDDAGSDIHHITSTCTSSSKNGWICLTAWIARQAIKQSTGQWHSWGDTCHAATAQDSSCPERWRHLWTWDAPGHGNHWTSQCCPLDFEPSHYQKKNWGE